MATLPRRRITEGEIKRVRELHLQQPSLAQIDIAKIVGISKGAVNGILQTKVPAPAVEVVAASPPAEPETAGEPDPMDERQASLKSLRGARRLAEANKDPIRIIQAALGAAKVAGDIERANPKPPDVAKLPKTKEIGAKARQRLHDVLTRMQQQAADTM